MKNLSLFTSFILSRAFSLILAVTLALTLISGTVTAQNAEPASPPAVPKAADKGYDYHQLMRELQPRVVFEVQQERINAYLRAHPGQFDLPANYEDPQVAFGDGVMKVSARTKILVVPTRVRVTLLPQLRQGRLHFKVHRVSAGPIHLPFNFQRKVGDTLSSIVNEFLEQNELQVEALELERGLVRITALAGTLTMMVRH